jgi:hypothetical protein
MAHPPDELNPDLSRTEAAIDQAISSVRKIADRVLLFFPPEALDMDAALPAGYVSRFRHMLRTKAAHDVAVIEDEREAYGLNKLDFIHAASDDASLLVSDHLNYTGALKVAKRLADRARTAMR